MFLSNHFSIRKLGKILLLFLSTVNHMWYGLSALPQDVVASYSYPFLYEGFELL